MARTNKALIFVGFGAFFAILGAGLLCGGGFNSVMQDPENGPFNAAAVASRTTLDPANALQTVTDAASTTYRVNDGHLVSLIKFRPEIFNCNDVQDIHEAVANNDVGLFLSVDGLTANEDLVDAAKAYCRRQDGEQAWTFALYFPLTLVVVALAFVAFLRKSGYTLSLVGVGLSAVMLSYTLVILVHYQGHSFIPQALNAFSDCDDFSDNALSKATFRNGIQLGTLSGPAPRRPWLCRDDYDYDDDLRTAVNLVYAGAAIAFLGWFFTLIGFAYIVTPFVTPVPVYAKSTVATRSADIDFDDESSYTYSEDYDY